MTTTEDEIRVENYTDTVVFVRFSTIDGNLRLEVFPTGRTLAFPIQPGQFAAISVTPDIRACYKDKVLSYEFLHHIPGYLALTHPEKKQLIDENRYAAVFQLHPVMN